MLETSLSLGCGTRRNIATQVVTFAASLVFAFAVVGLQPTRALAQYICGVSTTGNAPYGPGFGTSATGAGALACGPFSIANDQAAVAIQGVASTGAVSISGNADQGGIAVGVNSNAGTNSIAIGAENMSFSRTAASGTQSIAIGSQAVAGSAPDSLPLSNGTIAIGALSRAGSGAAGQDFATAVGTSASANGLNALAIGALSAANASQSNCPTDSTGSPRSWGRSGPAALPSQ